MMACFHVVGKVEVWIEWLKMEQMGFMITEEASLSMKAGIPSEPVPLLMFSPERDDLHQSSGVGDKAEVGGFEEGVEG